MGLIAYGLIALAILGAIGGLGYQVRESGKDAIRVEWAKDVAARKAEVEAERARQDALRAKLDKQAIGRLANEKKRTAGLMVSLDAHIKAAGLRSDCRITPELLGDANRALAGGEGASPGAVPSSPGAATPAR